MKKTYKKKLPKYWLGTRMPSLGYLRPDTSSRTLFSSLAGESLTPEVAQANILPDALNRILLGILYPLGAYQYRITPSMATAANAAANAGLLQFGSNVASFGTTHGISDITKVGTNLQNIGQSGSGTVAKTGLSTAGKALAWAGIATGLGQGVSDWMHEGDHRSVGDMINTLTTNTYTTDYGNTYKELAGLDAGAERKYESAQHTSKNINNAINAGSMALSATALAPQLAPVWWGAAGLYSLGSLLFGFGDNSEEIEQNIKNTQDYMAMYNRQLKSVADDADVKAGFYSGLNRASKGKAPVFGRGGKQNAWVSGKEIIGNLKEGWAQEVPGAPNKKDDKKANVRNDDFIINSDFAPYAKATGDYVGALIMLDIENRNKKDFKTAPGMLHAKCGKKPKFALGWPGYLMMAAPQIGGIMSNIAELNRVKNADRRGPKEDILDYGVNDAINRTRANKIDSRLYYNLANELARQLAWNIQRMPGLGLGGRAIMLDSTNKNAIKNAIAAKLDIDKYNMGIDNAANEMLYNRGVHLGDMNHDRFWREYAANQQINQAYEAFRSQIPKNIYNISSALGKDILSMIQLDQSQDFYNKQLDLWGLQVGNDRLRILNNNKTPTSMYTGYTTQTSPKSVVPTYILQLPWYGYSNLYK